MCNSLFVQECFLMNPEVHQAHNPVLARPKLGVCVTFVGQFEVQIGVLVFSIVWQIEGVALSRNHWKHSVEMLSQM